MKYKFQFRLEGLPLTPNGSHGHWRRSHGFKRQWRTKTIEACGQYRPAKPLKVAKCTFVRVSSQEPDDDNLRSSFKAIRDGLVWAGIIENDKPSNMPSPVYEWRKGKPNDGHVLITIEEMEVE